MRIRILLLVLLPLVAAQTSEPMDPSPETDPTERPSPAPKPNPTKAPEPAPEPDSTERPEPAPKPDPTKAPEPAPKPAPTELPEPAAETATTESPPTPSPVPLSTNNPPPESTPVSAPVPVVPVSMPVHAPTKPSGSNHLEIVGDNGSPSSAFPLGRCQGDCDNDNNCDENLVCYDRHSNSQNNVPGCNGTPEGDTDYCVRSEDIPNSSPHLENVDNNDNLERCQGDCDNDNDCAGSLVCYDRGNNQNHVPGCSGTPNGDTDYCVRPEDHPYQLEIENDGNLERCQGDCDNDNDCAGDLVCYNRGNNQDHVPGCRGTPNEDTDYCIRPEDHPDQLEPKPSPSPNQAPAPELPSLTPTVSYTPSISSAPTITAMPTVSNATRAVLLGGPSTETSSVEAASTSASSPTFQARASGSTSALLVSLLVLAALL